MESYSLHQLNEYIRRVIALNFREPLWIEAEIIQARESRGHWYLELIEKKEHSEEIIAQASAALWFRNFQFVRKKIGEVIHDLLQAGTLVRLKCMVEFNERYGLKLIVQDVDPNYTFGKLEMSRQEVIQRLQREDLIDKNGRLPFAPVLQNIAVISSLNAAGYKDFIAQLTGNIHGYTFNVKLFEASVQGKNLESETLSAIESIARSKESYDAAVIIRGGGSRLDLKGYDSYHVAAAIASSGIPFITGIGHEIDVSVVDMVAKLSLKTPTAVADYLLEHNLLFESNLENTATMIAKLVQGRIQMEKMQLQIFAEQIKSMSKSPLDLHLLRLEDMHRQLVQIHRTLFTNESMRLERYGIVIDAADPGKVLQKGFAYITRENRTIRWSREMEAGQIVNIHLQDGQKSSKII